MKAVRAVLAALVVVLGLAGWGLWISVRPPQEGSLAVRFARDMRLHHAQAVELSMHILERPVSAPVRLLAQDIAVTQEAQIGQMGGWLDIWGLPFSGRDAPMAGMNRVAMGMATEAQVRSLDTLSAKQAETEYLELMIQHHRGGVQMAQDGLKSGVPQVQTLARAIVQSQTAEISLIAGMLKQRGAAVPAGLPSSTTPAPGDPANMDSMPMNMK
ncbi:DUF305 domain-containing protein (plasmid) [Deinococcus sp. KNUC1210]|uniref:DUF305 domain-containing protein n=1 Tax=Deinococcus sp. KNUC1210 TaxID=2917691 RepID=UPI001EF15903|nr:DUF305 domain-containing protein [Deinococcus sp. KNUC1210]ULH14298.1 DUF305 domain-containing protein [Deinococcus sp. KNUC1210]